MKWSHRIQIVTGQTCIHILLQLILLVVLVTGWRQALLPQVAMTLLAVYSLVFIAMLLSQTRPSLRRIGDFLEDVTTTYYFAAAMLLLYLISRVIHHHLLLGLLGVMMITGPAIISLIAREPQRRKEQR
ncbi:MAG: Inner membrane protein YbhQ [Candidatus Erwinia impunctatus]|nr:Inner membrane protein YbhQ [Culicoides impunctatus]